MKLSILTLAIAAAALLVSCAEPIAPPTTSTGRPYAAYATTNSIPGPANSAYSRWTTTQLQERRKQLYYMVPQTQDRRGIPEYVSRGGQLPQQDEIRAIEGELNRRYRSGDKTAELKPVWPEERRHV